MAAYLNDETEAYLGNSKGNKMAKSAVKALALGALGGAAGLGGATGAGGVAEGVGLPGGTAEGVAAGTGEGALSALGSSASQGMGVGNLLDVIKGYAKQADAAIGAPVSTAYGNVQNVTSPITNQLQALVGAGNVDKLIGSLTKDPEKITDQRGIPSRIFDLVLRHKNPFNQDFTKENVQQQEATNRQKLAVLGQLMGAAGQLGGQEHQSAMQDSSFIQQKNIAHQDYLQNRALLLQKNASAADLQALEAQYNERQRAIDQGYHQSNISLGAQEQRTTNREEQSDLTNELALRGFNQTDNEMGRMKRQYELWQQIGGNKAQAADLNRGARAASGANSPIIREGEYDRDTGVIVGRGPTESSIEQYEVKDPVTGRVTGMGTRNRTAGGGPQVDDPVATKARLAELMAGGPKANIYGPPDPALLSNPTGTQPPAVAPKPTVAPTPFGLTPDVYKQAMGLVGGNFTSKEDLKNQSWQKLAEALTRITQQGAEYKPGTDETIINQQPAMPAMNPYGGVWQPKQPIGSKVPVNANQFNSIYDRTLPDIEKARQLHKFIQSLQ